jgi:hypothetical protein
MRKIYKHLRSPEIRAELNEARNSNRAQLYEDYEDFPHAEDILKRLHGERFFQDLECTIAKERIQSADNECHPHQDIREYHSRPVFRFPADGVSTTYIDFHVGKKQRLIARLGIKPGQVSKSAPDITTVMTAMLDILA